MSTYKVRATKTTTGMQVAAGTRGFEITFDEPGSTNTGMNPVEILLASFGACQSITATALAQKRHFDLQAFWVDVEGDLGRAVNRYESSLRSATRPTCAVTNPMRTLSSSSPTSPRSARSKTP